jgi:hypothetical protein
MMILGETKYGRVNRIPGLFYVATGFFHINFLPIFPVGTYVLFDGTKDHGVRTRLSLRSIVVGYLRTYSFLVAFIASLVALLWLIIELPKGNLTTGFLYGSGVAAAAWSVYALTFLLGRPNLAWSLRLAEELDIPLERLAQHVADNPKLQKLFLELREQHFYIPVPNSHESSAGRLK